MECDTERTRLNNVCLLCGTRATESHDFNNRNTNHRNELVIMIDVKNKYDKIYCISGFPNWQLAKCDFIYLSFEQKIFINKCIIFL